jgi:hypothetical protein
MARLGLSDVCISARISRPLYLYLYLWHCPPDRLVSRYPVLPQQPLFFGREALIPASSSWEALLITLQIPQGIVRVRAETHTQLRDLLQNWLTSLWSLEQ